MTGRSPRFLLVHTQGTVELFCRRDGGRHEALSLEASRVIPVDADLVRRAARAVIENGGFGTAPGRLRLSLGRFVDVAGVPSAPVPLQGRSAELVALAALLATVGESELDVMVTGTGTISEISGKLSIATVPAETLVAKLDALDAHVRREPDTEVLFLHPADQQILVDGALLTLESAWTRWPALADLVARGRLCLIACARSLDVADALLLGQRPDGYAAVRRALGALTDDERKYVWDGQTDAPHDLLPYRIQPLAELRRRLRTHTTPYPGIDPCSRANLFHGRRKETAALLARLDEMRGTPHRWLSILGGSGVGKSSLLRAGLLPSLQAAAWALPVDLRLGVNPWQALLRALSDTAGLPSDAHAVDDVLLHIHLVREQRGMEVVFVVDALDDLFVEVDAASERVLDVLDRVSRGPSCGLVVAALRVDLYPSLGSHPAIQSRIGESPYLLQALDSENLEQAIRGPAEQLANPWPDRVVDALLAAHPPSALPFLQMTLNELWRRVGEGEDPSEALHDLETSGGIASLLTERASRVISGLGSEVRRDVVRALVAMVDRTAEGGLVLRPLALADGPWSQDVRSALHKLAGSHIRVVRLDVDDHGETVVSISHRRVLEAWRQLSDWVDQEWADELFRRRVRGQILARQEERGGLWWDSPEFEELEAWRERLGGDLDAPFEEFYLQSKALRSENLAERERARDHARQARARSVQLRLAVVIGLLVTLVIGGALAFYVWRAALLAELAAQNQRQALWNQSLRSAQDAVNPAERLAWLLAAREVSASTGSTPDWIEARVRRLLLEQPTGRRISVPELGGVARTLDTATVIAATRTGRVHAVDLQSGTVEPLGDFPGCWSEEAASNLHLGIPLVAGSPGSGVIGCQDGSVRGFGSDTRSATCGTAPVKWLGQDDTGTLHALNEAGLWCRSDGQGGAWRSTDSGINQVKWADLRAGHLIVAPERAQPQTTPSVPSARIFSLDGSTLCDAPAWPDGTPPRKLPNGVRVMDARLHAGPGAVIALRTPGDDLRDVVFHTFLSDGCEWAAIHPLHVVERVDAQWRDQIVELLAPTARFHVDGAGFHPQTALDSLSRSTRWQLDPGLNAIIATSIGGEGAILAGGDGREMARLVPAHDGAVFDSWLTPWGGVTWSSEDQQITTWTAPSWTRDSEGGPISDPLPPNSLPESPGRRAQPFARGQIQWTADSLSLGVGVRDGRVVVAEAPHFHPVSGGWASDSLADSPSVDLTPSLTADKGIVWVTQHGAVWAWSAGGTSPLGSVDRNEAFERDRAPPGVGEFSDGVVVGVRGSLLHPDGTQRVALDSTARFRRIVPLPWGGGLASPQEVGPVFEVKSDGGLAKVVPEDHMAWGGATGRSTAVVSDGAAVLFSRGNEWRRFPDEVRGSIYRLAISEDERLVAGITDDGVLHVWDAETGRSIPSFVSGRSLPEFHGSTGTSLSFSADGALLVVGFGAPSKLALVDARSGDLLMTLPMGLELSPAVSPDGRLVAMQPEDRSSIRVMRLPNEAEVDGLLLEAPRRTAWRICADGSRAVEMAPFPQGDSMLLPPGDPRCQP